MAEGEHTIISKIPRERLNQIAGRKLSALGIPVRLAADRETLEGDLAFATRVVHPLTAQPIARARFVVEGHDHLRFVDPPLSALPPVLFYDLDRTGELEARVAEQLQRRASLLGELASRMRALRMEAVLEPERLLVRSVVKTPGQAFEILGGPEGIRVSRVAPVGGKPFEVPLNFPAITLEQHASLVDLELWLDEALGQLRSGASRTEPPRAAGTAGKDRVEATPPPRNALTLGQLAQALGAEAVVAPNAPFEVFQEFQHAGTRYRFVATRDMGALFKGRLIGPAGDVWSDRFDLGRFPGTPELVAGALGVPAGGGPEQPAAPSASEPARQHVPDHLMPRAGEVWVMNVVVEQSGGDEVRYVGTDIDGRPYGAARVLKRSEFEAVFSSDRGGWRLLILVDQVKEGSVLYRQLDPQRHPMGAPRRMATSVLVANFVPEAAAF
jgi:hypothetical protein